MDLQSFVPAAHISLFVRRVRPIADHWMKVFRTRRWRHCMQRHLRTLVERGEIRIYTLIPPVPPSTCDQHPAESSPVFYYATVASARRPSDKHRGWASCCPTTLGGLSLPGCAAETEPLWLLRRLYSMEFCRSVFFVHLNIMQPEDGRWLIAWKKSDQWSRKINVRDILLSYIWLLIWFLAWCAALPW